MAGNDSIAELKLAQPSYPGFEGKFYGQEIRYHKNSEGYRVRLFRVGGWDRSIVGNGTARFGASSQCVHDGDVLGNRSADRGV
jgi:hypothetical protein